MAKFESEQVVLQAPCGEVFDFLSDFRNLESLMPEQITNWKATEDDCSFTIQGVADLSMEMASRSAGRNIHIVSSGSNPVAYSLDYFFRNKDNSCEVSVLLEAELNPFLKSIASRPLQSLVSVIAEKLKELYA